MMAGAGLWAVDVYGRVFTLSADDADGSFWRRSGDTLLELKKVSASPQSCWGIGCDHTLFLNVYHSNDMVIRQLEETYENQRWNPVDGFTDTLLPTDRWQWTDEAGLNPQPLHSFVLPSANWEWEGDWYVDDESCGREATETGGWEYAVDFPATFTKEKKWNSCVRRRRWLRYRTYKALGSWAKVPVDKGKPPPEPFTDICCGGWNLSISPEKIVHLWAVSQQGKLWLRSGTRQQDPEGTHWEAVNVPREVAQVSAGPGDLLWAVLWDGQLLARTGITRDCPKGSSWEFVRPPNQKGVVQVAVGVNVVWAVTKDNKVWFRRGVNSHNPSGLGWISISGEMVMLSVGHNDLVWGVGSEDRMVYFRYGVTSSDVTGSSWMPMSAQLEAIQNISQSSVHMHNDVSNFTGDVTTPSQGSVLGFDDPDSPKPRVPKINSESFISALVSDRSSPSVVHTAVPEREQVVSSEHDASTGSGEEKGMSLESSPSCPSADSPWSNVDLEEAKSQGPRSKGTRGSVAMYPMELQQSIVVQEETPPWAWVTAGGSDISSCSPLNNTGGGPLSPSITPALSAPNTHFQTERAGQQQDATKEQAVCVTRGSLSWWRDWTPHQWEEVGVTLEQVTNTTATQTGDTLYIYYTQQQEKKFLYAVMKEVTALVPVFRGALYTVAVYTPERTKHRCPILLATSSKQDFDTWLSLLNASCCASRGLGDLPSKQALWAVTSTGDVMVHEPLARLEAPGQYLPCDQMFWRQVPAHLQCVESNSLGVVWGIGHDHTAWVYTGNIREPASLGGENSKQTITDIRSMYVYENQRWNPMTGYTDKGLPTDRYMWSDESGLSERTKESTMPPSPQWTWVSDWIVDHSIPGGADKEGWQYAADFPVTFHGYKTLKDFVRRRRWLRKCAISLSGPWLRVPPIALTDVTVLPCLSQCSLEQVPVWAISEKGDVLCRIGVTPQDPAGNSWLHVGTDQPFRSICIGGGHQVWAIARDGSVFYRGSVSAHNPAGECWYHIPSPPRQTLKQVSVGRTSVYAVDDSGNLWYRQGLTPSYPQGSAWELISNNVCKVSVGSLDQLLPRFTSSSHALTT